MARKIILDAVGDSFISHAHLHLADALYYCPSREYVEALLVQDETDKRKFMAEKGDCDKFATLLHARFVIDAWKEGSPRAAHCARPRPGSRPCSTPT